jgi:heme-degrading monooxygenase HmoA
MASATPDPPYYAVIFTSRRTSAVDENYEATAARMFELAAQQPGCLGFDSAGDHELSITVSYWNDERAIAAWKRETEHAAAQASGRADWYDHYEVRVARVERAYGFERSP